MCLSLATNTALDQRSGPSGPRGTQTRRMIFRGTNNAYVFMYLVSITQIKTSSVLQSLPGREEQPLESKDHPHIRMIHDNHCTVVVSLVKTEH
jgi:hypothetical protein